MQYLTYMDLNGKRRPRRFVLAAAFISLGLLLFVLINRSSGYESAFNSEMALDLPPPEAQVEVGPGGTPASTRETPQSKADVCPVDPGDWRWVRIFPADHYQRIEPGCVYEGVAQVSAWVLAVRMGYTKEEAAAYLEFERVPQSSPTAIRAMSNTGIPVEKPLTGDWPAHPDFNFWQVDREGRPAVAISLRGCYMLVSRAYCVIALDRLPGAAVSVLGEHAFTSHAAHLPATRSFFLLQYQGAGSWSLIGQFSDLTFETTDVEAVSRERIQISERLGTETWNEEWLAAAYGLNMKPLPEGWRLFGMDAAAVREISDELNRFLTENAGEDDV